ncbi:MAG: 16S rRNA (guanine(966)-N(2))-methyltransferase RsmD [Paenibacillaceae bacterium]|jgi:16S rRNA (guanine(966)-N(2))-methyltransferase RsmD|nr:16S rRNA (guanine(966)-N(2))-methyltransferase RsmD [Paenibacillaceae bacterium]
MRIIAGEAKGTRLRAVAGQHTRPTADKVKESLFHRLGPYFSDGIVIDLFAGTGALALEALSRGATHAHAIDRDARCIDVIKHNAAHTRLGDRLTVWHCPAMRAIRTLHERSVLADIVFVDPPYGSQRIPDVFGAIEAIVAPQAVLVLEHGAKEPIEDAIGMFACVHRAVYGDTVVAMYRAHEKQTPRATI